MNEELTCVLSYLSPLKKLFKAQWSIFFQDFLLIVGGLRRGCLPTFPSARCLSSFNNTLRQLHDKGMIQNITTVTIDSMTFVVNIDFLNQSSTEEVKSLLYVDVDVSKSPQFCDELQLEYINNFLNDTKNKLIHSLKSNKFVEMELDCGLMMVTVIGWILEYPVVYFYGNIMRKSDNQENNLSNVNLILHELYVTPSSCIRDISSEEKLVMSYSVPESIVNSNLYQQQLIEKIGSRISRSEFWMNLRSQVAIRNLPYVIM
eukprot:TRINITY_DN394_c0_g1_i1.p1 TRINITY_DN394_c0_g1~~TRINITY_DN394_c0_g1_i1.p1  ORF type:complete len:260 (+),score=16.86 TRINITY_DN394_c0_g1_i1:647-1426(+)